MTIRVTNAGPDADTLHVLPTAWFRNTWSWDVDAEKPELQRATATALVDRAPVPRRRSSCVAGRGPDGSAPELLFCDNETNTAAAVRRARPALPEGRHQRPRRLRAPPPSTPSGAGTQGGAGTGSTVAGGRDRRAAAAAAPRGAAVDRDLGPGSTRWSATRQRRGRRVLRRADARRAPRPTRRR